MNVGKKSFAQFGSAVGFDKDYLKSLYNMETK